ncbi:MAG: DUF2949 domain-containing protein [Cyanobacteria bacterium P01_F01_bin.153]
MTAPSESRLIQFLKDELNIASQEMAIALKHPSHKTNLPTILWQYGIITSSQLDQVFSWLENNAVAELG